MDKFDRKVKILYNINEYFLTKTHMSAAKRPQKQIHIVLGALILLVGFLVASISFTYADSAAYDVGIEKITNEFVYGKFKGQRGIQFTIVLNSNISESKAKSSLNMRCRAVPAAGEELDFGEQIKKFSVKINGQQNRKFFYPLDERGAKFVRRMPSDAGTLRCLFNLPGNIVIKKDFLSDSNLSNDTVEFEVYWATKEKTLKVSNFERR